MANNFYEQYYESQKAFLSAWEKLMTPPGAEDKAKFNPMSFYGEYLKSSRDVGNAFMKSFENPQNIWDKANDSLKYYQSMYDLWSKLSDASATLDAEAATGIYNEWLAKSKEYMKANFPSFLPAEAKELTTKFFETSESYSNAMESFWKPWGEQIGRLNETFSEAMFDDPKAYMEYLDLWKKNYDLTFSKLMQTPAFGLEKDYWDLQKSSLDRFVKYTVALNEYLSSFFQIAQDATKKVLEDYMQMFAEGKQPKTFQEFYKYWTAQINEAYHKVLFSSDFSKLVGHVVEAMSEFKMTYDKLFELYLANVPVPKKSEMDSLYKTVYDLKKELRALKADFAKLKAAQAGEAVSEKSK